MATSTPLPLCLLSSNGQCLDLSTTCHLYHRCLKTNPNLTIYSIFPSYNIHPLLLSFKVMYCIGFPPSFELTGDWTPHRQTGLLLPSTNQSHPQEISNCGEKQVLHWETKYYKIWVGLYNYFIRLLLYERGVTSEHVHCIGSPWNWLRLPC